MLLAGGSTHKHNRLLGNLPSHRIVGAVNQSPYRCHLSSSCNYMQLSPVCSRIVLAYNFVVINFSVCTVPMHYKAQRCVAKLSPEKQNEIGQETASRKIKSNTVYVWFSGNKMRTSFTSEKLFSSCAVVIYLQYKIRLPSEKALVSY
uniref:Uncharacterized protein n=1 Tax=Anguilla anguilla TaxID=7936 RepID=A0A0E9W9E0_ANGAN